MPGLDGFTALLDYPMYVVTTAVGRERSGCLVGFASQCSLDPPRFAVWLSRANHTYRVAAAARFLAVHLLHPEQHGVAELFGSRTGDRIDKFSLVRWQPGPGGVPLLPNVAAWFVGRIVQRTDWGDHTGFLLSPIAGHAEPLPQGRFLGFRDVQDIPPGHPA